MLLFMLGIITGLLGVCLYFYLRKERLMRMAYHDPLTGLANRNKLEQFFEHAILHANKQHTGIALLFFDLDHFKNINDSMGHDAGDVLLKNIAERLSGLVRHTDMVARLGGDEFVLAVTDMKHPSTAAVIAKKILNVVLQAVLVQGKEIYITTSIGISTYPQDGKDLQTLMKHADLALYRAKEFGRNNYQFFLHEMTNDAKERLLLKNALGHALATNQFVLHYQPKMDIKTKKITGVEALLRWKNEQFKWVTPHAMIALAEETGLIIPVSEWVLHTACTQLKKWHELGLTSLTIAVNCSARQLKQASFVEDVQATLTETGIPPQALELEVTESIIMENVEGMVSISSTLRDLGVKIVIDNFGVGYSSLNNLRRLSIDKIKIDKSFTNQIIHDDASGAIIVAILAMAKKLDIKIIAEGVERQNEWEFLRKENCDEIQGYYITRPLTSEQMTSFLTQAVSAHKNELVML